MNQYVARQDLEHTGETASPGPPPPDFRRAQRHSARVRWIRRLLPLTVIAVGVVIGAGALLNRLNVKIELPFDVGHLTLSGSRLTMELPKLSGFTEDNRGYSVTARVASQDLTRPDVVDLADIDAKLEMADHGWTSLQAKSGTIDTKGQLITLDNGVELAMKGGYGGHLENAEVDVKSGVIVTRRPVEFTYLDGKLVADAMTVTDRGARALFKGNVQLDFRLSSVSRAKAERAEETAREQEARTAAQKRVHTPPPHPEAPRIDPSAQPSASTEAGDVPLITSPRPVSHP